MSEKVACADAGKNIENAVSSALDAINFSGFGKNDKIVIKPNVNEFQESGSGANTSSAVIDSLVSLLIKKSPNITIAEGTSIIGNALANFRKAGYYDISKKYGIELIDLNKGKFRNVKIPNAKVLKNARISETILGANKIVNVPVLKTHVLTTITCALKNMKGCLHPNDKLKCHTIGLDEAIVDYNRILKPDLVIVDATTAMQGSGPHSGEKIKLDRIFAGTNSLAVDYAIAKCAGIPVNKINHLDLAIKEFGIPDVEIINEKHFDLELPKKIDWLPTRLSRLAYGFKHKVLKAKLSAQRPEINPQECAKCRKCLHFCPESAFSFDNSNGFPEINGRKCIRCLVCVELCPYSAIKAVKQ